MLKHNVLTVDDEVNILHSIRRLLRSEGYNILAATSGKEALSILKKETVSLIISDQKMPEMEGVELLQESKKICPDTIRIMLTGYADIKAAMKAINSGEIYRFITKPWDDLELKITIRQALKQYELIVNNRRLNELTKKQNIELRDLNVNLASKVEERTRVILHKKDELAKLYKELEKNFFDSIRVFVEILELYNPFFGKHSKRTALFSRMIAGRAGLKEKHIESVEIAAMLHDIGMIGIPKEISDAKPETLESEKRYIYEQHPVMGQAAIQKVEKLNNIGDIIRAHHERFDGTGFPDGLKGEDIPIEARIIAVADFYDEIHTIGYVHIDPSDNDAIRDVIEENSGTMFDSCMVQHLFFVLDSLKTRSLKERQVSVNELTEGMVISRELYTSSGLFLMGKDTVLNEVHINKIKSYNDIGSLENKVYIY